MSEKNRATPHKKGLHEYMFLIPTQLIKKYLFLNVLILLGF